MLTLAEFKDLSAMPPEDVDVLEARYPGFALGRLSSQWSWIGARLAKRYAPFTAPVPPVVLGWLTDLVTLDLYVRRGFNPSSEQDMLIKDASDRARLEIKEAADSKDGLFDLPLLASSPGSSGVERGGPLSYSEQSPYVWMDLQRAAGRDDDERGSGS